MHEALVKELPHKVHCWPGLGKNELKKAQGRKAEEISILEVDSIAGTSRVGTSDNLAPGVSHLAIDPYVFEILWSEKKG